MARFILLFSVLISLFAQPAFSDTYVKLFPKVQYSGSAIYLRDIGQIRTAKRGMVSEEISNLRVEQLLTNQDDQLVLNKQDLEKYLKQHVTGQLVKVSGLDRIEVVYIGAQISGSEIETKALSYLRGYLSEKNLEFQLSLIAESKDVGLPSKDEVYLNARLPNTKISKRMCVFIDVMHSGVVKEAVPVWIDVKATGEVLILTQDVSRGDLLGFDVIDRKRVDLALNPGAITNLTDAALMFSGDYKKDTVLTANMIQQKAEIISGHDVWVVARQGVIEVQGRAKAMNDGYLGEQIDLLSISSNKRFKGKVIADGKVLVDD